MLQSMHPPAAAANSKNSPTFAGLLAALAAPSAAAANQAAAWREDGLADDVATLSYERALRTHARYRSTEPDDCDLTHSVNPEVLRFCEALPDGSDTGAQSASANEVSPLPVDEAPEITAGSPKAPDRNLKCASVTIRLSKAECDQLHRRAAEAGLTVSAYLRSCTFETESLRALVKDTLAQLRTGQAPANHPVTASVRRGWRRWMAWFRRRARAAPYVAQA